MKSKSILKGDLSFLSLPDILQIVGQNNKTGTLRITSQYGPSIKDKKSTLRSPDRKEGLFVVKGPRVDYVYIVDEEHFSDGAEIFKEGAHGNWIWVILKGMVKISKKTKKGPLTIVRLGEGCFLGTFGCLAHGLNRRSATVTAIGEVSLGLLDSQRLSGDFACLSPDFKGLLLSLDDRLRKISGRAVNLFVKKHDINEFIEGENLIPVRDTLEENVFYIKKGEVYVIKRTPSGDLPLITLEKKDVFGYVPFMNISPELPFTSLLASKDLKLGNLDRKALKKEYDQLSGTLRNLIYYVSSNVSVTTRFAINLQKGKALPKDSPYSVNFLSRTKNSHPIKAMPCLHLLLLNH